MVYVIIAVVILVAVFIISMYNALVGLRNRVKNQWAQVDVQLKKRFDLVPNLVETVKGYAVHEKSTLEAVIKARNAAGNAGTTDIRMEAEGELGKALGRLMMLAENYPDLKANQNFLDLQRTLHEVENQIAMSRQFYNDTVMKYENKRQMFPANMVASMFGFKEERYFEVGSDERENVKVAF